MEKFTNNCSAYLDDDPKTLVQRLLIRIKEAGRKTERKEVSEYIHFVRPLSHEESKEYINLNSAFHNPDDQSIPLLLEILLLWQKCDLNSATRAKLINDALCIFGKQMEPIVGQRLIFTVTANKQELRCWYGIPGFIDNEHVDSNGQGLLFFMRGRPEKIKKYIHGLLDKNIQKQVVYLPNKTAIFGFRWE